MDSSIRGNYVPVTLDQWTAVYELIYRRDLDAEEKKAAMKAAFAEHGTPINGYINDGTNWSFVDAARNVYCEPLMEVIVEKAPNKATEGLDILGTCVWSEKCLNILLQRGYEIPATGQAAVTLLRQCAEYGTPDTIALLAAKGLALDQIVTSYGTLAPAIVISARHAKAKNVESFLRAGASATMTGDDGETFLHACVRLIETKPADRCDSAPKVEALRHVLEVARELNIDIDLRDGAGRTPLHTAAKFGYKNKIALLLEYGANADLLDENQETPLMLAKAEGHEDAVKTLLSWKAHEAVRRAIRSATLTSTPRS